MTQHKPCRAFITTNNGRFNKITDKHTKIYSCDITDEHAHIIQIIIHKKIETFHEH